jgi:hypothetical protein
VIPKLVELELRHVDASKLLLQRIDIDADPDGALPEWYESASTGQFSCVGWYNGAVLATLEAKAKRNLYVAVVAVSGLFANDDQVAGKSKEKDDSVLANATEEEMSEFGHRAVMDIYPFLRQELYQLTGHFHGLTGVMLQPHPLIGEQRPDPRLRRSSESAKS